MDILANYNIRTKISFRGRGAGYTTYRSDVYSVEFDRRKVRTSSRKDTHRLYRKRTIISPMLDDSKSFDLRITASKTESFVRIRYERHSSRILWYPPKNCSRNFNQSVLAVRRSLKNTGEVPKYGK